MSEPQWHCYFDRTQDGPLTQDALTRRFGERLVPLYALVWSDAWKTDEWRPAREVEVFRRAAVGPPLKPPAAVPAKPALTRAAVLRTPPVPTLPTPGAALKPAPRRPVLPPPVPPRAVAAIHLAQVILPPPTPWARFWARIIDFAVGGNVLLWLFVFPFAPDLPRDGFVTQGFVGPLCWMVVEAFLLTALGTTPGKWVFDIQVQTPGGNLPGFGASVRRCLSVFLRGLGAGIPPFTLVGISVAYSQLMQDGQTAWDRHAGLTVVRRGTGWLGWSVLTLGLCAAVWILITTRQP